MSASHDDAASSAMPTPPPSVDAREGAYSPDGVDLTLVRWMLSLTPAERLEVLQSAARSLGTLLGAARPRRAAATD